jgi:hypothetical protein
MGATHRAVAGRTERHRVRSMPPGCEDRPAAKEERAMDDEVEDFEDFGEAADTADDPYTRMMREKLKRMTMKERISYAVSIGAKGKRYRRIVDDCEYLPSKSAGTAWDVRDKLPRGRNQN